MNLGEDNRTLARVHVVEAVEWEPDNVEATVELARQVTGVAEQEPPPVPGTGAAPGDLHDLGR